MLALALEGQGKRSRSRLRPSQESSKECNKVWSRMESLSIFEAFGMNESAMGDHVQKKKKKVSIRSRNKVTYT